MRQVDGNPSANRLQPGTDEVALRQAVTVCGHPLQAAVMSKIRQSLESDLLVATHEIYTRVQEEWTFLDSDTQDVRALDGLVEVHLLPTRGHLEPRIRPVVSVLVECKQSDLPYIFFTRDEVGTPDYPSTSGFPWPFVALSTDNDRSTYSFPLTQLWGLHDHPFVTSPLAAVSFSKARRVKGSALEITGEDAYRGLTLPMMKAVEHLRSSTSHRWHFRYSEGRLVVSVAVLRAPMISVGPGEDSELEAVPWVRVVRYEPKQSPIPFNSHRLRAFDVVHEEYLQTYISVLADYAVAFTEGVLMNQEVLLAGRGFAKGLRIGNRPVTVKPVALGRLRSLALGLIGDRQV